MFCLHSLTYITYGYILGNILLHSGPPETLLQIQIHLGVLGVYRVWRVMSFLKYQLPDLCIIGHINSVLKPQGVVLILTKTFGFTFTHLLFYLGNFFVILLGFSNISQ